MQRERIPEIHFYEWRVQAWLTSECRDILTAAGRGIYRELLDHCYTAGTFPDDETWMCRKCACTIEELQAAWAVIGTKFYLKNGRRGCPVADIFRREYRAYIAKQREHRKRGWEQERANPTKSIPSNSCLGAPSKVASTNGNITATATYNGNDNTTARCDRFAEFQELYPEIRRHSRVELSRRAYQERITSTEEHEKLMEGLRWHLESEEWVRTLEDEDEPGRYTPNMDRFIRDGLYLDRPVKHEEPIPTYPAWHPPKRDPEVSAA